jgi:hypothetical protein
VQPIEGVSYRTAGGESPGSISIDVSDDNKWRYQGELLDLSAKNNIVGYGTFRYATHDLRARGRYLSLAVVGMARRGSRYVFCDDVERLAPPRLGI